MKNLLFAKWIFGAALLVFLSKSVEGQFPEFPFSKMIPSFPTELEKSSKGESEGEKKSQFSMWNMGSGFPNFGKFNGFGSFMPDMSRLSELPGAPKESTESDRARAKERRKDRDE